MPGDENESLETTIQYILSTLQIPLLPDMTEVTSYERIQKDIIINKPLIIHENAALEIDPGVTITFKEQGMIWCQGNMTAGRGSRKRTTFLGNKKLPGNIFLQGPQDKDIEFYRCDFFEMGGLPKQIFDSENMRNHTPFGAAILGVDTSLLLDNCRFNDNNGYGGAINMHHSSLRIIRSQFLNNTSFFIGGALALYNMQKVSISTTKFQANHAHNAGGAIALKHSPLEANALNLSGNEAEYGGAVYATDHSKIKFKKKVNIEDNKAKHYGGGVVLVDSSLKSNKSSFSMNLAQCGGAFYLLGSQFMSTSDTITKNKAQSDAAIYGNKSGIKKYLTVEKNNISTEDEN